MSRPLDGLLVVSLEQAIAAPYCTRLLADQGARVIKVERPDGGDFARAYDTRARGLASHFVWTNRSKESLALDLKDRPRSRRCASIIAKADVFVQNLAPGAATRLGLGAAELRARAIRGSITCSISGYGSGGPAETAQGLRPPDPGGSRLSLGHRHAATRWPRPASRSPTSPPA